MTRAVIGETSELYAVLRRSWRSRQDLGASLERSADLLGEQMSEDVRWIRSYVLDEDRGEAGTVRIYQATSPEAIRRHALLARLPVDEIVAVADTLVVREDPHRTPFAGEMRSESSGLEAGVSAALAPHLE